MKYNNFLVMLALCVGFASIQIQAAEQPVAPETQAVEGWGSYLYGKAKSAMGYATGTASSAAQAAHKTVQNIGYQKVGTAIMSLMWVAGQFGFTPMSVATMVYNFATSPELMKRMGQAAMTVASTTASVATSSPAVLAYKVGGLSYLGSVDTQNKYNKLAFEVINAKTKNSKYTEDTKKLLAQEYSNFLLNSDLYKTKGDNVSVDDFNRWFTKENLIKVLQNSKTKASEDSPLQQEFNAMLKAQGVTVVQPIPQAQIQTLQSAQKPPLFQPNLYGTNFQPSPQQQFSFPMPQQSSQQQYFNPTQTYQQPSYSQQQQYPIATPPQQYQQGYQGYPSLQGYSQYQQTTPQQQNSIGNSWPVPQFKQQ